MNDLMQGILKKSDQEAGKRIRLQVFDNELMTTDSLLYDSQPKAELKAADAFSLLRQSSTSFNDHLWHLRFIQTHRRLDYSAAYGFLLAGLAISLLLFGLLRSVLNTRFRAQQLAERLTVDLRESESNFRAFFESMTDMILAVSPDGRLLFTNAAVSKTLGFSPEELAGMRVLDLHPADRRQEAGEIFGAMLRGERESCPLPLSRKDGELVPASTHIWFGRWNRASCIFGISKNLTIEQESQQRFEHLFRHNPALMAISTIPERRFYDVNDAFLESLGYSKDDIIGKTTREIGLFQHYERQSELADKLTAEGQIAGFELKVLRKDGSVLDGLFSGEVISSQGQHYFLTVMIDITERRRAEEELRKSHWRLENIIEGTQVGTWEWNVQTGETVFNMTWAQIVGYTLDELAPISIQTWMKLVHPEDMKRLSEMLERHFAREIPFYNIECRMRHKDGRWVWIQDCGRVITRTADGKPLMMFGSHTDITKRKQSEALREELEAKNRQIQKSESLSRMAGAIAHHFNNQLMTVMMSLDMAKHGMPAGVNSLELVDSAAQAAHKAAEVSTLMLTYLGQTAQKQEALDIAELCHHYLPILRTGVTGRAALETDLPKPGPAVMANASQIQQLVGNLVNNAWEALSGKQGIVRLAIALKAESDIPDGNRFPIDFQPEEKAYACLEVSDTGCGISDSDIEKIFDPFFSTKFTGRGLGLAVVLGIVRAHNGVITVESNPGHGTAIRVYLPVSSEALLQKTVSVVRSATVTGSGTVLLVEDEASLRAVVSTAVKSMGFKVLEAQDGITAVNIFQKRQSEIRLVITDLTMPCMDGWETLTALRKIAPNIPVILASGYSEAQVMAGHHPELPHAFLSKPYEFETLSDAISHVLEQEARSQKH
jgi:PAS domain S-box-containing protein